MYKSLLILTVMTVSGMGTMAQSETNKKNKEIKQTRMSEVINVSANDVWKIVGPGFEDAWKWSTAVDHSEGSGEAQFDGATCNERYCEINAKGFNKINESLVEYSDADQILAYQVNAGLPGFVTYVQNRWRIVEVGPGQCQLEMTITMRMKPFMGTLMGGMFRKNLDKTISGVMRDLKVYAETGEISEEKKKRMDRLAVN